MVLTAYEALQLIRYHREMIRKIKEDPWIPDNEKPSVITGHKNRIEELRKYA